MAAPYACRCCFPALRLNPAAITADARQGTDPPGEFDVVPERTAEIEDTVRAVLRDILGLSVDRAAAFDATTPLFGALPELDSMAVAGVLTELEDRLGILIEDDDIDGETMETFGSLVQFASGKALI
ncbi:acyl carrier protein [Sphingomonas sp. CFBP 13720]|jgi:acyl carrier protein|nr:acyl carrier protein [Sphingomonas sp. CFBP 13720]